MKKKANYLYLCLIAIAIVGCRSNPSFTLQGNVPNWHIDSVFIYNIDENVICSAPMNNGSFTLKGSVQLVDLLYLGNINAEISLPIIVENAHLSVEQSGNDLVYTGGRIDKLINGYKQTDGYKKALGEIIASQHKAERNQSEESESELKRIDSLSNILTDLQQTYLKGIIEGSASRPEDRLMAYIMLPTNTLYNFDQQEQILSEIEKQMGFHPLIDNYRAIIAEEREASTDTSVEPATGELFIEIEAIDVNGTKHSLSEVLSRNKLVLVDFWASWCGPCIAGIPEIKRLHEKYKDRGFEVFGVSIDDKQTEWKRALKKHSPAGVQVCIAKPSSVTKDYALDYIPSIFLISSNGTILAGNKMLQGKNLDATIEQLLRD